VSSVTSATGRPSRHRKVDGLHRALAHQRGVPILGPHANGRRTDEGVHHDALPRALHGFHQRHDVLHQGARAAVRLEVEPRIAPGDGQGPPLLRGARRSGRGMPRLAARTPTRAMRSSSSRLSSRGGSNTDAGLQAIAQGLVVDLQRPPSPTPPHRPSRTPTAVRHSSQSRAHAQAPAGSTDSFGAFR